MHSCIPCVVSSLIVMLLVSGCPVQTTGGGNEHRDPPGPPGRVAPRSRAVTPDASSRTRRAAAVLGPRERALIERFFARYSGDRPGASFIMIKGGKILAQKSYGYADLTRRVKASAATNYRTASVTKQFTAMAVMLLIHDKKLSYESTLTDVFGDFPAYGKKITIKHLLRHRSGLVDYRKLIRKDRRDQVLDSEVLRLMKTQRRTLFPPGTRYKYSNSGYAVLAEVVARVSGVSFAQFLKRRIFEPLGMKHSAVVAQGTSVANRALGHVFDGTQFVQKDQSVTSAVQGDGGVYTSILDYTKWDRALSAATLLPRSAWQEALTPRYDDPSLLVRKYGHGWRIDHVGSTKLVHHSGHTLGFTNYTLRIPQQGFTFAAFTNRGSEDAVIRIGNTLAALFSGADLPVPIEAYVEAAFDAEGTSAALQTFRRLKTRRDRRYLIGEDALLVVGRKLRRRGKTKDAIRVYRFNLKENPLSFRTWFELANCQHELGSKERAAASYTKALRLIPKLYREVFETATKRIARSETSRRQ
ncbi:MAG: serine hydrolase [bacterium]